MQDPLLEDFLGHSLVAQMAESLVNHLEVLEVWAPLSPVDKEDFTSVELEAALDPANPATAPLVELEAWAMPQ